MIKLPKQIVAIVSRWDNVYKSPYSDSLYNRPYEQICMSGTVRIANHWNYTNGRFQTDRPVRNGLWSVAENKGFGVWIVKKSYLPNKQTKTLRVEG